jgi:hypothetical protein
MLWVYARVHLPSRLRRFRLFDVGSDTGYFDDGLTPGWCAGGRQGMTLYPGLETGG